MQLQSLITTTTTTTSTTTMILLAKHYELLDTDKEKKLKFITRQIQLLCHKTFSTADY